MKRIFKWLTKEGHNNLSRIYCSWFSKVFDVKDFRGLEALMVAFVKYCNSLGVVPSKDYLESYLKVDGKKDIKKYNIKTDTMGSYNYNEISQLEESYRILSEASMTVYDDYISNDIEDKDFKIYANELLSDMKKEQSEKLIIDSYTKLNEGFDVDEVSDILRSNLFNVMNKYNNKDLKRLGNATGGNKEEKGMRFICKTGIPVIDGITGAGGIYTSLIYTLTAQPGGGKTRFGEIHFAYQVMVQAKEDVIWYETELSERQTKNILIAYHIIIMFNGRVKIPDSILNKPDEMTEQQKQYYEAAKIDLFESGKYGKFFFFEQCVVEEMEDEIVPLIENYKVGLLAIDYMGLIKSKPEDKYHRKVKYEVITEAYELVRDLLKVYDIAALCINQYSDEGISAAYAGKTIRPGHIQGGQIVQRHTDFDMHLTYTEEQKLANVRSYSNTKSRGSAGTNGNVLFSVDLSVSLFKQQQNV